MSLILSLVFVGSQVLLKPEMAIPLGNHPINRAEVGATLELKNIDKGIPNFEVKEYSVGGFLGNETQGIGVKQNNRLWSKVNPSVLEYSLELK